MPPSSLRQVFRAYDIRGLAPEELDEEFARRLGHALVAEFHPKSVMVGHDMRPTSPALENALIETLLASGVNVTRIGLCSTPMFNILVGLSNGAFDLGVMVTASHNPGIYNGFKMVRGDVSPIGQGSGMEQIAERFFSEDAVDPSNSRGTLTEDEHALERYIAHVLERAALPDMPDMRAVIDAGNGMAGAVLPAMLERLPWLKVDQLYFVPDGSFPNHEANPLKTETLRDLTAKMKEAKADFGVAFDGDADRVGFTDEKGEPIPGDLMGALLASELLRDAPGGLVLYDVRSSWAVPDAITAAGGVPRMCRVGHAFIKRQMREEKALFASEVSMHYYFADFFNVESSDFAVLLVARMLAREGKPLSELIAPLRTYAHSGEINFEVEDKDAVFRRVEETYGPRATTRSDIDGLRLEFREPAHPENDWWFSLRASNTEPVIRLNLETRSVERTSEKVKELSRIIEHK